MYLSFVYIFKQIFAIILWAFQLLFIIVYIVVLSLRRDTMIEITIGGYTIVMFWLLEINGNIVKLVIIILVVATLCISAVVIMFAVCLLFLLYEQQSISTHSQTIDTQTA